MVGLGIIITSSDELLGSSAGDETIGPALLVPPETLLSPPDTLLPPPETLLSPPETLLSPPETLLSPPELLLGVVVTELLDRAEMGDEESGLPCMGSHPGSSSLLQAKKKSGSVTMAAAKAEIGFRRFIPAPGLGV